MRELIKRFFIWFVSGIAITLGVLTVMYFAEIAKPLYLKENWTANAGELLIEHIEPLTITRSAGAIITIKNTRTDKSFEIDRSELSFHQGNKLLFSCDPMAYVVIKPNSSATQQVICEEVDRASLPVDVRYEVNIKQILALTPHSSGTPNGAP